MPATPRSSAGSARPTAAASPIFPGSLAEGHQGTRESLPSIRHAITGSERTRGARRRAADADSRRNPSPIEGVSFAHVFKDAKAESRHKTQYFEMFAHRSIYHDGWRAVCPFPGTSFKESGSFFGR